MNKIKFIKVFPVPYYVIGGGENGGKTTMLAEAEEICLKQGMSPIFISEAATQLFNAGISFRDGKISPLSFQRRVIERYLFDEAQAYETAAEMIQNGERPIIFSDRSILDSKIYLEEEAYVALLKEYDLTHEMLLARPTAYFHLVTVANGAAAFYKQTKNRPQTPEQATENDNRLFDACIGSNHLHRFDNTGTFEDKKSVFKRTFLASLGLPAPIERERKFIFPLSDLEKILANRNGAVHIFRIEQKYILNEDFAAESRIRKFIASSSDGDYPVSFCLTTKESTDDPEVRIEREERISKKEYSALERMQLLGTRTIRKDRHYFFENGTYFEIDRFLDLDLPFHSEMPDVPLAMLEVELAEEGQRIRMPKEISCFVEVTGDKAYKNRSLAQL